MQAEMGAPDSTCPPPDDISRSARRRFLAGASVLLALTLVLRGTIAGSGWFFADDLATLGRVYVRTFSETVRYGEGGHIAFVTNALGWLSWRLMAFTWPAHIAWMLLGFSVTAALLLSLLVRLYGRSLGVLCCWAVFLLSSAMAPSLMWLSQSSILLGLLAPSLLAGHSYLSYARGGGRGWLGALLIAVGVGLSANERVALLAPELVLLVAIASWRHTPRVRLLFALGALFVIILPYIAFYSASAQRSTSVSLGSAELLQIVRKGLVEVWIPTMSGGPWQLDTAEVLPRAVLDNPLSTPAVAFFGFVLALGAVRVGWRAVAAAGIVLGFGVLDIVGVIWARYGSLGDYALVDWRYYSHTAVPIALALAIMFVAPVGEGTWRWAALDSAWKPGLLRTALICSTAIWATGAIFTSVSMAPSWASSPARAYLGNTLADLAGTTHLSLVDRQLPSRVVPSELTYATRASWVLAGAVPRPSWSSASTTLRGIDDSGRLSPVSVVGGTQSPDGPEPGCGWRVNGDPVTIPLKTSLYDWNWVVELRYLSSGWMSVPVSLTGDTQVAPFERGAGTTQVPTQGSVSEVTIGPVPPGGSLCVDRVLVGEPAPTPGSVP